MAQAKTATPSGKLSLNYEESVQQKTDVGDRSKAIAGAKRQFGLVSSKYAITECDDTGVSLEDYRKALGPLALQLTEAEIWQAFTLSDRLSAVLFDMWRASGKGGVK